MNVSRKFLPTIVTMNIVAFWIYKGYYPFNTIYGRTIHYFLYDCVHIIFNISNFQYNDKQYYCKSINQDKITEINNRIKKYDFEISQLNKEIMSNQSKKNNISEFEYDNIQSLYDMAHITKDNYYVKKAENKKKIIKNKQDININIDKTIILQRQLIQITNVKKNIEKQKLLEYCVELL